MIWHLSAYLSSACSAYLNPEPAFLHVTQESLLLSSIFSITDLPPVPQQNVQKNTPRFCNRIFFSIVTFAPMHRLFNMLAIYNLLKAQSCAAAKTGAGAASQPSNRLDRPASSADHFLFFLCSFQHKAASWHKLVRARPASLPIGSIGLLHLRMPSLLSFQLYFF